MSRRFKAVLFDLDGVLADSTTAHYAAWRRLADELGIPFDETINERLKGVSRMDSLDIILEQAGQSYDAAEKDRLAARKNGYYRDIITTLSPEDLLPGALDALKACRTASLKVALASASRNAPMLVERLGLAPYLNFIADASKAARSKPAPDIFQMAAAGVGVPPEDALAIEDAAAGVKAAKDAGCTVIGVGDRETLWEADHIIADMTVFRLEYYITGP